MRVSFSLLGPVDPSFRALSGRPKFTVRRHKLNVDSLSVQRTRGTERDCHQPSRSDQFVIHYKSQLCTRIGDFSGCSVTYSQGESRIENGRFSPRVKDGGNELEKSSSASARPPHSQPEPAFQFLGRLQFRSLWTNYPGMLAVLKLTCRATLDYTLGNVKGNGSNALPLR